MWLISTWSKNPELLIRACRALDQINWHKDGVVMWIQDAKPCPVLLSFYAEQNLTIEEHPVHQYLVDIPTALSFQIRYSFFSYFIRFTFIWNYWKFSLPDDVYVKSLERCHAATIYNNWPYKDLTTIEYVKDELDRLPSAGLFLKETDKLVCMIMGHPPNGMSRLFTLDEYRGRGYARLVIQYISKRMAQSGLVPFGNIGTQNESSMKCFRGAGLRHYRSVCLVFKYPSFMQ